jgi:hypothetical protein
MDTCKLTYHNEWVSKFPKGVTNADWGIICAGLFYRDTLLIVSQQTNCILEMNPNTMAVIKSFTIGDDGCGFRSACLIPNTDTVYLIKFREPGKEPWTETIYKWNIETNHIVELNDFPISFVGGHTQNAFNHFVYWRDELYITPFQGDSILKIDLETDEIKRVALSLNFDFFERKSDFYNGWAKDTALPSLIFNGKRMKFTVQLPYDYSLADIDLETGEISNRRKWHVEGVGELYRQKGKTSANELWENNYYLLDDYLEDLSAGRPTQIMEEVNNKLDKRNANMDGTSGKAIYDYVKKLVNM